MVAIKHLIDSYINCSDVEKRRAAARNSDFSTAQIYKKKLEGKVSCVY